MWIGKVGIERRPKGRPGPYTTDDTRPLESEQSVSNVTLWFSSLICLPLFVKFGPALHITVNSYFVYCLLQDVNSQVLCETRLCLPWHSHAHNIQRQNHAVLRVLYETD